MISHKEFVDNSLAFLAKSDAKVTLISLGKLVYGLVARLRRDANI